MNLTPPGLVLAILILATGIVGLWTGGADSVPWWRVLAGLFILALICELLITRARAIAARVAGGLRFYLGREQSLELEFDNPGHRALALRFVATVPDAFNCEQDAQTLALAPLATHSTGLPVRPHRLGRHAFASLPARVRGPLGLAWWSRRLRLDAELLVLPDTLGARGAMPGATRGGSNSRAAIGGTMELNHLRDYRPGDALHAIDWKATARSFDLVTRVFNEDQHLEVMLLIDIGRTSRTRIDALDQFGHYANLAARFAEYCVASDDRVGLVAFADRPLAVLPPGRGVAAVQRLRRALTGLAPAPVESDVLRAALELRRLLRHRSLVVILTDLYEQSATSALVQASRLLLPTHLPFVVGLISDDVVALADAPATDWLDPYRGLAARDYLQQIAGNAARLRQLGAQALTARPGELDRKVLAHYDRLRAQRRI